MVGQAFPIHPSIKANACGISVSGSQPIESSHISCRVFFAPLYLLPPRLFQFSPNPAAPECLWCKDLVCALC